MNQTKINIDPFKGQKEIKIAIGLDVSTSMTGYAVLVNGKPFELPNGKYSVGQIAMVETRTNKAGNQTPIEYTNYGDKMFHGSFKQIREIAVMLYQIISPINAYIGELKQKNIDAERSKQAIRHDIPKVSIDLIFEVSEIPNGPARQFGQTITGVRKLALYVGAVENAVANVLYNAGFHFLQDIVCKLIKPSEWQDRLWKKQDASILDTNKEKGSKLMSLHFANIKLKEWGLDEITYEFNDMADAINIATLSEAVRDNVFAKSMAKQKSKEINITHNRDILKLSNHIAEYKAKALVAKNEFIDNIIWTIDKDYDKLDKVEKAKYTKYSKLDLNDTRAREIETFLTPSEQRKLNDWIAEKAEIEAKLTEKRNSKVLSCQN